MDDRKKKSILFGCLITVSLFAILIVVLANIKITPLKVFKDPQYKFSLKYPTYWRMELRSGDGLALVSFFAPKSSEFDMFAENVNITVQNLGLRPRLRNLDAFTKETVKQLLGTFGEFVNVVESKQIRMGGLPAYRITYVTSANTGVTGSKIKYLHVWVIRENAAFILTFIGIRKEFDDNLRHVNRMIKTFKFE